MTIVKLDNPVPFGLESALVGLVASVAMEEAAISNLINMETKKLEFLFCMDYDSQEEKAERMLQANDSVTRAMKAVGNIEKYIAAKLHMALQSYSTI